MFVGISLDSMLPKMKSLYSLWTKIVLLLVLWSMGMEGIASSLLSKPDLAWKNLSVLGKRMSVYCIFTDSRGIVWLGTNNGLFFYDGVATHAVSEAEISKNQVYDILEHGGELLLGTNRGLMKYSFRDNVMAYYDEEDSPREIRSLLLVDHWLWAGSLEGMFVFDLATREVRNVSAGLPDNAVYSILRDARGILYAGTYDGLARWDAADQIFHEVEVPGQGPGNLFVNCLLEAPDRQSIYIGTEGSLYRYTPLSGAFEKNEQLGGTNIKCLAQGSEGPLWVGTDKGVFELDGGELRRYVHDSRQGQTLSNNEIWCIHMGETDNIWVGNEMGFSVASGSTAIQTVRLSALTHSGEGNDIHSIYRDSRGTLWINGTSGIIKLSDGQSARWYKASGKSNALSHNHIRAVKEDSDGTVWFATDGGLNRYNAATDDFDVFHVVDKEGRYASNWVYALEEDNGHFIIGSYLGGLHYVSKSKFKTSGGEIVSDQSVNVASPLFKGSRLPLRNDLVNKVVKDAAGSIWILCFNDDLLTEVKSDGRVMVYDLPRLGGGRPNQLVLDKWGRVWCAFKGGAAVFDADDTCHVVRFPKTDGDESALAMERVGNCVWVSTVSNVWNINGKTFEVNLLPVPQKSYKAIYADSVTGKVYLGSNDEITEVAPRLLDDGTDRATIKMVLADMGDGIFDLSRLLPGKQGLTLPSHGSLNLIVSNLNYTSGTSQRYCYKLAQSRTDTIGKWIILPEDFNTISLSELKMGDYYILLKTVGTLASAYAVPLHVQAPWPLSWWAFCLYVLAILSIMTYIIWYMRRRNVRLLQEEDRRKSLEVVERKLTFLSNISHDLKTPLSLIMGPVSVLKERAQDEEARKSLETVYENAVRLNSLIHRTLEINQLENDEEDGLILSTFNVVNFCKSIFESFKESHPQKKFVFYSSVPQFAIEADAVKLESILNNLLSNACKYSEDNATISCGISLDDRNIRIVVSDDGMGIAEMDQPLVFQRMFRAPSTSKMREGTGIGLYLVKKYIELMNGRIELHSEKGQGTSFVITMPLSEKAFVEQTESRTDNADYNKPKILIVEDNLQISAFIHDLLKKDYTCLMAENGRAGLSLAASFLPDLIITDELMPVMNGMEMIRRLKQNPHLANIPTIMLTAQSDNDTESESVKSGVDIFMEKPFVPSVLQGRIAHLLQVRAKLQESIRIEAITEAKPIQAESASEKLLAQVSQIIEDNISDPDLNVNMVCEKSSIPNKQFYRLIKKYLGMGPLDYIRSVRLQKAAMLLSQKRFTVSEVCYMVGFKSASYFAKCFQEKFGVKPSQYPPEGQSVI